LNTQTEQVKSFYSGIKARNILASFAANLTY
jgi:hypothetical protein